MTFRFEPRRVNSYTLSIRVKESLDFEKFIEKIKEFSNDIKVIGLKSTEVVNVFLVVCMWDRRPDIAKIDSFIEKISTWNNIVSVEKEVSIE